MDKSTQEKLFHAYQPSLKVENNQANETQSNQSFRDTVADNAGNFLPSYSQLVQSLSFKKISNDEEIGLKSLMTLLDNQDNSPRLPGIASLMNK